MSQPRMSSRCSNPGSASGSGRRRSVPSVRRALSQDGYDAGVKKPVAVPNSRKTPSGVVWETSRLHVTRSPCTLGLDAMPLCLGAAGGAGHDHDSLVWWLGRLRPVAMGVALERELAHLALDHPRQAAQPA